MRHDGRGSRWFHHGARRTALALGLALLWGIAALSGLAVRGAYAQSDAPAPPARESSSDTGEPAEPSLGPVTKLPLPRYVSLRSNKINVRRGPGQIYRIDWVFRRVGLPVRIIDEYRDWRRIVDSDDAGGWVFHSLLSGRRTVLVTAPIAELHDEPSLASPITARAEQGVVATLVECEPAWCDIETDDISGWVRKEAIWGVDPDETLPD